jgi:hypothetical protein
MTRAAGLSVAAALLAFALFAHAQTAAQRAGYSAAELYNAANAYARAGNAGLAVLNYERAHLIDPRDPDIEANLRQVRQKAGLPASSPTRLERLAEDVDPSVLPWTGIFGLLILGMSLLARERQPQRRGQLLAAFVGVGLLAVTFGCAVTVWPTLHEAVVVGHSIPARVSPTLIEEPLFVISEADVVSVGAEHDGFSLVKTRAGRTGWAPSSNLAPIVPRR